ncbi:MAG: ATP-binding protein [Actinomycetota bacterium]
MILAALIGVAIVAGLIGFWLGRGTASAPVPVPVAERPRTLVDRRTDVDIERAMADLRLGVVVVLRDGTEAYRNNRAQRYATGRHGDALVEAALQRVLEGALVGLSLEESVEVYGPPARSLLVQASPTYDGGELDGAVGVIDDVTEARHVDRVRSDFVANVSHELRTPVGAMSVLAETIADADDPEIVDRLTSRMQREANRLSRTIDDLLALSRLESGPISDPETIDLVSVATMAVERTGEAAQQRRVLVIVDHASDGPILVDGDQGQLVSAIANLIDNAIKYSDPGGEVTVRLDLAAPPALKTADPAVVEDERADMAEISVIDQGIGIPERDLDRIFERFYRVDSARSRETGGTGLGLSIVRHALQNHRAAIDVESTEGIGSTFTVRLPVSPAQAQIGSIGSTDEVPSEANGGGTG